MNKFGLIMGRKGKTTLIVGFSYTRKQAEKDAGRFTIVFVARLFTF